MSIAVLLAAYNNIEGWPAFEFHYADTTGRLTDEIITTTIAIATTTT
jgi:hypothetical protein